MIFKGWSLALDKGTNGDTELNLTHRPKLITLFWFPKVTLYPLRCITGEALHGPGTETRVGIWQTPIYHFACQNKRVPGLSMRTPCHLPGRLGLWSF